MRSPRGGDLRRIGLVVTAALAACAPIRAPEELTPRDLQRAAAAGQVPVLARFHRADTGEGIFVGGQTASVAAFVTGMEDGRRERFGSTTASADAGARGWVLQPLAPGTYYMVLGGGEVQGAGRAFTFSVPAGAAAYVGSFPFDCPYTVAQPCQDMAPPVAEPTAAHPPLPEGLGAVTTRLAQRFELSRAALGWPAPSGIATHVDPVAVQSAVNWEDFVSREGSRRVLSDAGALADVGMIAMEGRELGAIIAAPFFAAALGAVAIGGLASGAEAIQLSAVERQWRPCLESLSGQMAPAAIGPRLAEALAVPPSAPARRPAEATPWRADVTRVVLRRCSEPREYGVEVATRWTAPGREARFLREVPSAQWVPGLAFPSRMPWEAAAGGPAPCRPLAEYCQPQGRPLVADAVVEAVTAARDALLAGR
jgi:hypothetical protein